MPVDKYGVFHPTASDVERWFNEGIGHAKYLAVITDTFDGEVYPQYSDTDPREYNRTLLKVCDVYDLSKPFGEARVSSD